MAWTDQVRSTQRQNCEYVLPPICSSAKRPVGRSELEGGAHSRKDSNATTSGTAAPTPSTTPAEVKGATAEFGPSPELDTIPSWLVLPSLRDPRASRKFNPSESVGGKLDIIRLLCLLRRGHLSPRALRQYLSHIEDDRLSEAINQLIEGINLIFFIADSNDADILRVWVAKGGNIDAYLHPSIVPLIAFVILLGQKKREDTTLLVKTLVSLGADTSVIPRKLLIPFPDEE